MTAPTARFPPTSAITGFTGCLPDASANQERFQLLYAGDAGITLSRGHRLVEVGLARSNGAPALCPLVPLRDAARR